MKTSCHLTSATFRRTVVTYPSAGVQRTRESSGGAAPAGTRRYIGRARRRGQRAVTQGASAGASHSGSFTLRVPRSPRAPRCAREALPGCWERQGNGGFPQRIAVGIVFPCCRTLILNYSLLGAARTGTF